ncbi:MAG: sensor histidine kinase [Oscillospiraceae bacterium]|nr:sensor histidine kinase [Oscillospiraceae bacterium]
MFFSYLRHHYKIIILLALFVLIFTVVFSLYDLETEAVLYAALLCFCVGLVAFGFGLWHHISRHKALRELIKNLELGLYGLPEPDGMIEQDYHDMLRSLYAYNIKIRGEADGARRDAEDYYTLWVHQIKTPIAAMRLLLAGDAGADANLLLAELFKTEQYVDMVLQYTRLNSESSDLVIKKCLLDDIIKGCLRKYARLFSLKKLDFSLEETHMTVITDEKWLAFAIEQLFSNSLKYTNEGKISIYSEGEALVIEDTGIGIRPEDLPRVCEKGYTGASGRADKKSTGIGLFLVKSILERLGHGMEIASKVGVGTKVTISLGSAEASFE